MENKIGSSGPGQVSGFTPQEADQQTATVLVGETQLSQVADRLGISQDALMAANPNLNPEGVLAGQELHLPQQGSSPEMPPPDPAINDAGTPSNIKSMVGDLNFGGQMRELQIKAMIPGVLADSPVGLFSDFPDVLAGPDKTSALRAAMLPAQLDAAKIPAKLRDELTAQASKKSGAELNLLLDQADAALASKDPAGGIKSLVMQGRIDDYFGSFDTTYHVNGKDVKATPHFRISGGFSGPPGRTSGDKVQDDLTHLIQTRDKGDWNDAMKKAVHMCAYGRPTSAQLKMVTEALIKTGQFEVSRKMHPGLSDAETIRMMQWDHGVGIDCAGYVQQAFMGVHGGGRADYGFKSFGDENLISLKGNPHFAEVKPTDVKPGDLIILDAPQKGDVGHTVLVRDHHTMKSAENKMYSDADGFAKAGDKVHVYQVDASFGAGEDGSLEGGLQRKTWLFNETTGKWAEADPNTKGGFDVHASTRSGPYNHPMNGIYHPKTG